MNNQLRDFAIREIPEFPGYFAGDDGFIYSNRGGNLRRLAQRDNGRGYMRAQVGGRPRAAHVLVAAAFIGPRPDGKEINHVDGCKLNNRPTNLEYVTRSENMKHSHAIGLSGAKKGQENQRSVLTNDDVLALRDAYNNPKRKVGDVKRVIDARGLPRSAAYIAASGKTWRHVS